MQIKVKVVEVDGVRKVLLPTYMMIGEVDKDGIVTVQIPDDEVTDCKPDAAKIRAKYKNQPLWDRDDLADILNKQVIV